ncbi:hypothetical protein C8R43DRAFT_953030 [Mycena crocata]|nr:hypothetical protein C8R43DRAFT_953030 [Mycena crocata]
MSSTLFFLPAVMNGFSCSVRLNTRTPNFNPTSAHFCFRKSGGEDCEYLDDTAANTDPTLPGICLFTWLQRSKGSPYGKPFRVDPTGTPACRDAEEIWYAHDAAALTTVKRKFRCAHNAVLVVFPGSFLWTSRGHARRTLSSDKYTLTVQTTEMWVSHRLRQHQNCCRLEPPLTCLISSEELPSFFFPTDDRYDAGYDALSELNTVLNQLLAANFDHDPVRGSHGLASDPSIGTRKCRQLPPEYVNSPVLDTHSVMGSKPRPPSEGNDGHTSEIFLRIEPEQAQWNPTKFSHVIGDITAISQSQPICVVASLTGRDAEGASPKLGCVLLGAVPLLFRRRVALPPVAQQEPLTVALEPEKEDVNTSLPVPLAFITWESEKMQRHRRALYGMIFGEHVASQTMLPSSPRNNTPRQTSEVEVVETQRENSDPGFRTQSSKKQSEGGRSFIMVSSNCPGLGTRCPTNPLHSYPSSYSYEPGSHAPENALTVTEAQEIGLLQFLQLFVLRFREYFEIIMKLGLQEHPLAFPGNSVNQLYRERNGWVLLQYLPGRGRAAFALATIVAEAQRWEVVTVGARDSAVPPSMLGRGDQVTDFGVGGAEKRERIGVNGGTGRMMQSSATAALGGSGRDQSAVTSKYFKGGGGGLPARSQIETAGNTYKRHFNRNLVVINQESRKSSPFHHKVTPMEKEKITEVSGRVECRAGGWENGSPFAEAIIAIAHLIEHLSARTSGHSRVPRNKFRAIQMNSSWYLNGYPGCVPYAVAAHRANASALMG